MRLRNTIQKQIVTQVIHDADRPLTVHEVLTEGQKLLPTLGLATVYREVGRMCEADELRTVSIANDPPRYEMAKHHHHHFKCTECDKVYELEGCPKELKTLVPKGFKAQSHELTFYGLCRVCA